MKTKFAKTALAIAAIGAVGLPASQAAAASKTENAIIGALLGGVAGAAVSNGKTEGVALGAVAGAALGAAMDKPDRNRRYSRGYNYRDTRSNYRDSNRYRSSYYAPVSRSGYSNYGDSYDYGNSYGYYGR
jgi:hypothetical protein